MSVRLVLAGARSLAIWSIFAVVLQCAAAQGAASAAPLAAALDRAVLDYQSGRHALALSCFEALARRGVPAAQFNLAVMHLRGEVPQPDLVRAQRLLTQAGQAGFVTAQFMLGQALETGRFGSADLVLAHHWYEKAAGHGSVEAQVAMGTAHYLGRGARKDPAAAVRWFGLAARGGDVGAQYLIASMYEQGDGVPQDLRLARYWYDIAAHNGDDAAPGKVKELDAKLMLQPS